MHDLPEPGCGHATLSDQQCPDGVREDDAYRPARELHLLHQRRRFELRQRSRCQRARHRRLSHGGRRRRYAPGRHAPRQLHHRPHQDYPRWHLRLHRNLATSRPDRFHRRLERWPGRIHGSLSRRAHQHRQERRGEDLDPLHDRLLGLRHLREVHRGRRYAPYGHAPEHRAFHDGRLLRLHDDGGDNHGRARLVPRRLRDARQRQLLHIHDGRRRRPDDKLLAHGRQSCAGDGRRG